MMMINGIRIVNLAVLDRATIMIDVKELPKS
jgi:hypothetical protein